MEQVDWPLAITPLATYTTLAPGRDFACHSYYNIYDFQLSELLYTTNK